MKACPRIVCPVFAVALAPILAAALPRPAAAQGEASCALDAAQVPPHPTRHAGTVVASVSPGRVKAATAWVERRTGATIDPAYADLPRVVVRVVEGRTAFETLAAVVGGPVPRPGERVDILSRHRDPRGGCSFIPWTVGSAPAVS